MTTTSPSATVPPQSANARDKFGWCVTSSKLPDRGTSVTLFMSGPSAISTITDAAGYNGAFTGTPTVIATAPANTLFKGLDFAPVPEPSALGVAVAATGLLAMRRRRR